MNTEKSENGRPFFLREDGQKVYIQAISMFELSKVSSGIEKEYRERREPIDPPTYTVKTAGGGELKLTMNESNLEVENDEVESAKRKTDWFMHQTALARMAAEVSEITTEIVLEGILCDPPTQEWIAKKKRHHVELPEDPEELLKFYKMIEILRTPGDFLRAQNEIVYISSSGTVTREALEAASATFLREVQGVGERQARKVADHRTNGPETTEKPLDTQRKPKRHGRGKGVGAETEQSGTVQS